MTAATRTVDLSVTGMTCASCVSHVEKGLSSLPGVHASVDLVTASARVIAPDDVTNADLVKAVESTGYQAEVKESASQAITAVEQRAFDPDFLRRLWVAVLFGLPVVLIAMVPSLQFHNWELVSAALSLPIVVWAAAPFHRVAYRQLMHGAFGMDALVSLGVLASWIGSTEWLVLKDRIGDVHVWYESAAAVTAFVLLGRMLEHRATRESGAAIRALLTLAPRTAHLRDLFGGVRDVPVDEVQVGDTLLVNPGESFPVDATVYSGNSAVDASMMTGESLPIDVAYGSPVIAGTINTTGALVVRATAIGAQTRLAQIAELVTAAQSRKAAVQRLADRISGVFVPIVLAIAAVTAIAWCVVGDYATAFTSAISVLVVACPCALGLATPTALIAGIGRGARSGILISGAEALEQARTIDTVLFDKTGTITRGKLTVTQIDTFGRELNWAHVFAVASRSSHPVSMAVATYAKKQGADTTVAATAVSEAAGTGISGTVDGHVLRIGKLEYTDAAGNRVTARIPADIEPAALAKLSAVQERGESLIAISIDDTLVAVGSAVDELRPESRAAIANLVAAGITPWLITGDHLSVATQIAAKVGIKAEHVRAGIAPEEKAHIVSEMRSTGAQVAMVGDGINDSAALAGATLGIAIGSGSDAAIAAGDITLLDGGISSVLAAIRLARKTLGTIRANLTWAFAYNVVMIPLAASGRLDPMVAGFAMAASSVLVVTNSLRLRTARL